MRRRLSITTGVFAAAVFLLWWSAWRPGFIDAEAIARLSRIRVFELTTDDPPAYTVWLWLTSIGGRSAALATLLQGVAWAGLAAVWTMRLHDNGATRRSAALAVGAIALLPAVAVGMLGLWVESLLALVAAWLLVEIVAPDWAHPIRLGAVIGLMAALGAVGLITALVATAVIALGEHAPAAPPLRRLLATAAAMGLAGWFAVPYLLGMEDGRADVAAVAPIVASALSHHDQDFPSRDLRDLSAVADIAIWQELYECGDPSVLLNDPVFVADAISSTRLREIGFGAFIRNPLAAVGQRICATVSLMSPSLPGTSRYYLPAYTIFPNTIGVTRDPLSTGALESTKAVLLRTQQPDRLAWWWRAALPVVAAGLVYALVAARKRRAAAGASLLVGLLVGTFVTGPTPEFQTALPLYLVGWMSVTLAVTLKRT